jgi:RNA:NAD 2''-phosphotransferase
MTSITLYHGTTPDSAQAITKNGWSPRSAAMGGNCGQSRYLYLTTEYEDALWFAQEKGSDTVLEVRDVPLSMLEVDPEDGTYDTVEEEISSSLGLPGKLVLTRSLPAENFSIFNPSPKVGI